MSSDDLVEIERYFKQVQSLKNLKLEMVESRKRIKDLQASKNVKKLFLKTLEKLQKYKTQNSDMQEQIQNLHVNS